MRPVIGIVSIPKLDQSGNKLMAISNLYKDAIIDNGGSPILLLPPQTIDYLNTKTKDIPKLSTKEKEMIKEQLLKCDGIIIPGGIRIYEYQIYMYNLAKELDINTLGICMGMQIMSYSSDKDSLKLNEVELDHHQKDKKYVHKVILNKDSILAKILKKTKLNVNSIHHYHIASIKDYNVVGYSTDGLIEAIEHPSKKFNIGIQWHPETMYKYDKTQKRLLKEFIKSCKK